VSENTTVVDAVAVFSKYGCTDFPLCEKYKNTIFIHFKKEAAYKASLEYDGPRVSPADYVFWKVCLRVAARDGKPIGERIDLFRKEIIAALEKSGASVLSISVDEDIKKGVAHVDEEGFWKLCKTEGEWTTENVFCVLVPAECYTNSPNITRLWIGNLPPKPREDRIRKLFSANGIEPRLVGVKRDQDTNYPWKQAFMLIEAAQRDKAIRLNICIKNALVRIEAAKRTRR